MLQDLHTPQIDTSRRNLGPKIWACDKCRSRKIRCDSPGINSNSTSCGNCIRRGNLCTYRLASERVLRGPSIQPGRRALSKVGGSKIPRLNLESDGQKMRTGPESLQCEAPLTKPSSNIPHIRSMESLHVKRIHHEQTPYYSQSGGRIAAELAFNQVIDREIAFLETLTRYGWEGSYLVQAGFNVELLQLGQGILQEIYIFLEFELDPAVSKQVAAVFEPFPVTIYTPQESRHIPWLPENESIWDLWSCRGIYRGDIPSQTAAPTDGNEIRKNATNGKLPNGHSSSGKGSQNSRGDKTPGKRPPGDSERSGGGHGGTGPGNNAVDISKSKARRPTREVSIPFSSTLTCTGEQPVSLIWAKTNACVDIKIEQNYRSQSRPAGMSWGGPWFETKMTLLDAEIRTVPAGKPEYYLNFSQIRFISSGSPSSILNFSPSIIRAEEDNTKSKTERNTSAGIRGVISASPSLRLEGTHTQMSGEERTQNRWGVMGHCLPSDRNEVTGAPQTTMVWKYTHNSAFYSRETLNVFEPKPGATFGLSRTSTAEPCLEVEIVTCYSWSAPSQTFRDWFGGRSKTKNKPPAFLNFLHQTSVGIDLEKVNESAEWVVGLTADERHTMTDLGKPGRVTARQLESDEGASHCYVSLQAALHGRMELSEEQKRDAQPLLESLRREISRTQREDEESNLPFLPTPSPSPSPASSMFNQRFDKPSGTLSEDSDMEID